MQADVLHFDRTWGYVDHTIPELIHTRGSHFTGSLALNAGGGLCLDEALASAEGGLRLPLLGFSLQLHSAPSSPLTACHETHVSGECWAPL